MSITITLQRWKFTQSLELVLQKIKVPQVVQGLRSLGQKNCHVYMRMHWQLLSLSINHTSKGLPEDTV